MKMKKTMADCFEYAKATTKVFGNVSADEWDTKAKIWAAELSDKGHQPHAVKLAFRKWCNNSETFPELKNILDILDPPKEQLYRYTGPDNAWSYELLTRDHPLIQHKIRNSWSPHTFDVLEHGEVHDSAREYAALISKRAAATMGPVTIDFDDDSGAPKRIEGY